MEEQQYENEQFLNPQPQRPTFLSVICILSFINGAWNALQNFIIFGVYSSFKEALDDDELMEKLEDIAGSQFDTLMKAWQTMFSVDRIYFLLTSLFYIGSFVGVYHMWKLQKKGLHIYAISQILILIAASVFFYGTMGIRPWGDVLWTILFVVWYTSFYKKVMD